MTTCLFTFSSLEKMASTVSLSRLKLQLNPLSLLTGAG